MASRGWASMPHHETPSHDGDCEVVGYRFIGDAWNDVEKGAPLLEDHPESYLSGLEGITYHYTNSFGDDVYFYVDGPFEDWNDLLDAIAESLDRYGIA